MWEPLSREAAIEILEVYTTTSPGLVKDMSRALEKGDSKTLGDLAHRFKSSSAMLGATNLSQLCSQVDIAAADGSTDELVDLVAQLETEFDRVMAALAEDLPAAACS